MEHTCTKRYRLAIKNEIVTCGKMLGMEGHCMDQEMADPERQVSKGLPEFGKEMVGQESGFDNASYICGPKY